MQQPQTPPPAQVEAQAEQSRPAQQRVQQRPPPPAAPQRDGERQPLGGLPPEDVTLATALGLYGLTHHTQLFGPQHDAKCLVGWSPAEAVVVVCFRGTCSLTNVVSGARVLSRPPTRIALSLCLAYTRCLFCGCETCPFVRLAAALASAAPAACAPLTSCTRCLQPATCNLQPAIEPGALPPVCMPPTLPPPPLPPQNHRSAEQHEGVAGAAPTAAGQLLDLFAAHGAPRLPGQL